MGFALGAVAALTAPAAFAAAGEPWYLNTTYWATGVLIIFLLFVGRLGAFGAVGKMLDSRANEIQRELDQAQKLREEASAMLKAQRNANRMRQIRRTPLCVRLKPMPKPSWLR